MTYFQEQFVLFFH